MAALGCEVFAHSGLTETGFGGGVECGAHQGYHLREADLFVEIVDPGTGRPLPDGEPGEIVVSTLCRLAMPLIRYRTGDLGHLLPGPCVCGSPFRRLGAVAGRIVRTQDGFAVARPKKEPSLVSDLLSTLNAWLEAGEAVASATILTSEGSTPRTAGSKMLKRADGAMAGTVGGGLVEARVLDAAAEALASGAARVVDFELSGQLAAGADMICGGRLRVFVERIQPGPDAALFRELADRLASGRRCLLLTALDGGMRLLLPERGESIALANEVVEAARAAARGIKAPVVLSAGGRDWLLEPWSAPSPLIIAGAGHVSRSTAEVAALAGFAVTVLDDRPEFANQERFPTAREVAAIPDLGRCLDGRAVGRETSVVIVTRGHVHDADVLAQALRMDAGYVGMIGSRHKRDAVYERLRGKGFTDADIARVHCPIGLDIGAETPEEIAVSIVAELIQERARRRGA